MDAVSTAPDTAFIATLQDVDATGGAQIITSGYLRAGLRTVDESASKPGAPVLPCTTFEAVPVAVTTHYRVPLVPNAHRFASGHRIRLHLTSDDQGEDKPAALLFRHASIGTSSLNTVLSTSKLLVNVLR
jgi:predicted acyl esterase